MGRFGVGQAVYRREDQRFLTGQGRYTDDINLPGQAYAYFLRSPHAHARLAAIDTTEAAKAPNTLGVYTAADIATDGLGALPCQHHITNKDGTRELGIGSPELRRRNYVPSSAMPYDTPLGLTFDAADFARNMDDAIKLARWSEFPARRAAA